MLTADFGMNKACNAPSEAKQHFASPSQPTSPGQLLLCLLYKQVNRGAHRFCSLNPGYTASHRQSWDLDQGFFLPMPDVSSHLLQPPKCRVLWLLVRTAVLLP